MILLGSIGDSRYLSQYYYVRKSEVNEGDEAISLITGDKTERIAFGETENLFVEFAKFLRGGPVPRITADDSFYITEVVLRAREAADEKKMIVLPPRRPLRNPKTLRPWMALPVAVNETVTGVHG